MTIESQAFAKDRLQSIVDWYMAVLHVPAHCRDRHVIVVHTDRCVPGKCICHPLIVRGVGGAKA